MVKEDFNKYISMDMREQIFDLLKERMEIADNFFTKREWENCFYELMNIQSKMDRLIVDGSTRRLIDDSKEKILSKISVISSQATNKLEKNNMIRAFSELPILVDWYKTELNNILFDSGVLFPIKKTHPTMMASLSDENFNMDNPYEKEYIKEVNKMPKEKIIELLSVKQLEDLYVKRYIENVLQK